MILETKRLILRSWKESDAESLYQYASDPLVGPAAGWPPHQDIQESLDIIRNVLCGKECYAVCLKDGDVAIGCIELKLNGHTDLTQRDDECELGYWLGRPFWGQGLVCEAAEALLHHGFEKLAMTRVWCGYYAENHKSKRVQEKLGFSYQRTTEGVDIPLLNEKRTGIVNALTNKQWSSKKGY